MIDFLSLSQKVDSFFNTYGFYIHLVGVALIAIWISFVIYYNI
jgi:hypothetical protein